jgi:hypothetical protein
VIMKADELLTSTRDLPWRGPISACQLRLNECIGDLSLTDEIQIGMQAVISEKPGGLNGSTQHWHGVYSLAYQSPKFSGGVD